MTTIEPQWAAAIAAVEAAASILIVTHVNPDGDAIGSLVGLANALRERGKKVDAAVDGGVPDFLRFLPGSDTVGNHLQDGRWELMVSVDASDEERTGLVGAFGREHSQKVINLDHHPTNTFFGHIYLVMPAAVSSTEVVYDWLQQFEQPISKSVALPLMAGLVTDTMGFRTSNVSAATLGIAQQLMAAGASLTEIMARALINTSYSTIELWKQALQSVRLDGLIISGVITQENLKRAGIKEVTDGGLVSLLNSVEEAMIAVVFKELADGRVEISFRSKPGFDVSGVAFSLGGGGHKQASGVTVAGPIDSAQAVVMPLLETAALQGKLAIV